MFSFSRENVKIFVIFAVILIGATFLFIPPSQYDAFFFDYLFSTAPIYIIGQLSWVFIGAVLLAIFYYVLREILWS